MKRLVALVILALALITAGCRQEAAEPVTDGGYAITGGSQQPVTLTYAFWGSVNERKAQEAMIAKFMEKYPWITVKYVYAPGDYVTKLTTMYASNRAPDVFMLYKHTALQWAEQGKLYNLNEFLATDPDINESSLIPNAIMSWDQGKVAGVKVAEEAFALYYNADLFEEAGIAPPPVKAEEAWTWDEFVETAKKLTIDRNGNDARSPNFDPDHIEQYGVRFNTWMWHLFVPSNETSIIAKDGSRMNLQDPAVIEAVQKLADLIYVHHVAPSPLQEKNLPQPMLALQSKKVAMDLDGQWIQLDLGTANVNYGVGVLPKLKRSTTVQFGEPIVMSATTKHPLEAWLFFKWLIDAEHAIEMHASGLWMPLLKDYYTEPDLIAKWAEERPGHPKGYEDAVMRQTLLNGVNSYDYYLKNIEAINAILNPALDQVFLGKKSVKQAFADVEDAIDDVFKGTYP
ncbi:multiple sugar transport system substrate-binding protein [Paenibacillus phyllosphaerae]|uniref:Multiple sugar transport system substrate-binding protein n=1 Tax=Paenibacillus phyllosphaerae TaxID=274593 RepID=A0A7W5AWG5_9BACL|nr:sugar ABC transporter substrate-binding protein [Paenibacillus phyllosphaerae]MBB3110088.1 multiple sugar transport system substrate-binding protein [Paenibacillus phyllosphaerae]